MPNPDFTYNQIREAFRAEEPLDRVRARGRLVEELREDIRLSRRYPVFRKLFNVSGRDRSIRILDFGCGGGQTVLYLRLLGYSESYGVDFGKVHDEHKRFASFLGIRENIFFTYDGRNLPFHDGVFDFLLSEQVLEHVFLLEDYYREAARVLKFGGRAFFKFSPQGDSVRYAQPHLVHPLLSKTVASRSLQGVRERPIHV